MKTYTHLSDEEFVREVDSVGESAFTFKSSTVTIPVELMLEIIKRLRRLQENEDSTAVITSLEEEIEDLKYQINNPDDLEDLV